MRSSVSASGPSLQQQFGGLYAFAKDVAASALDADASAPSLEKLTGKLERLTEREIGRLHEQLEAMGERAIGLKPACARGCWFCCTHVVVATAPEILLLAEHIRANWTDAQILELRTRIERHKAALTEFRSGTAANPPRTACPLLANGECSVWTSRPLVCRGWNSVRVEDCQEKMENPESGAREHGFAPQVAVADFIRQGLSESLAATGREGGLCELALGLEIALDAPDAAERYLAGEDIFAPARAGLENWS